MRKYHVDRNHFLFKLSKRATTLEMITMGIIISFVINPIKTPTPFIITFTIIHLHIHRKIQCFFSSIFSFLLYQVKIELFFVWVLFCTDVNFLFLLVVIFLFNSYCGIAFPRRSFLQDNVYMEQGYREASGGSFCILDYHTDVLGSWSIHGFHLLNVWSVCNNHETVKVLFDTQDIKIHYSQIKICCPTRV